jgi:ElaA protein
VRREVFIIGQSVPEHEEVDGLDLHLTHYLLTLNHQSVGTARTRKISEAIKIERVAILSKNQGKGLGKALMEHILSEIQEQFHETDIVLSSQEQAVPFYEKLNFVKYGNVYFDAGIPHFMMKFDRKKNALGNGTNNGL